jgi:hypothetical protein
VYEACHVMIVSDAGFCRKCALIDGVIDVIDELFPVMSYFRNHSLISPLVSFVVEFASQGPSWGYKS